MPRVFEELSAEEKTNIAIAIIYIDLQEKPLSIIEKQFDVTEATVEIIRDQAYTALKDCFKEKESEEVEDYSKIFKRIPSLGSKSKSITSINTPKEPSTQRDIPNLTTDQLDTLKIILEDINAFNKENPKAQIKATEGVLLKALEIYKKPAVKVIDKLKATRGRTKEDVATSEALLTSIKSLDREVALSYGDNKYPTGPNAGTLVTEFGVYLSSKLSNSEEDPVEDNNQEELTEDLLEKSEESAPTTGGKSKSKK